MQLNGLSLAITNVLGGRLNPLSWFAAGEQGAWYDPSDLTTLFQDSAGTTPMSAVGTVADQPVGLMLDKSKGLALGAELVTGDSSTFTAGVGNWAGTGASIAAVGGELQITQTIVNGRAYLNFPCVVGAYYLVSADVRSVNGVSCGLAVSQYGDGNGATFAAGLTTSNTFVRQTIRLPSLSGTSLYTITVGCNGAGTGVFACDNISVKQIAGNHAFQATDAKRPMLSARVNLLTKTEDFSDAVWTKAGVTATSDSITSAGSVAYAYKDLGANLPATAYSLSCKVKASTNNFVALNIQGNGTYWATIIFSINPLNPSVGESVVGAGTGITISNTSISLNSDGYFTISAVVTCATSVLRYFGVMFAPLLTGNTFVSLYGEVQGNPVGKTIFTKQADLRPTNSGALLPPYQRVNTESDYDTVGFPLYLKANGTSSAMSTNSIDFTATDKMTVVTGVRKLSNTGTVIMELSTVASLGAFLLSAPYNQYGYLNGGTILLDMRSPSTSTYEAPLSTVLTAQSSISTPLALLRINSGQVAINVSSQGSGNFGNYPLYLFARAGTTSLLNGQFYGAIIRGAQSDTASVTQTENYMATKTGITF